MRSLLRGDFCSFFSALLEGFAHGPEKRSEGGGRVETDRTAGMRPTDRARGCGSICRPALFLSS
jgi:hypothetical protein